MVMADRPGVKTAPLPETALTLAELGARMSTTLATLPMHQPWRGPESLVDNTVHESVREILKTLLTFSLTLPTPRLRSLEKFLDDLCRSVLRPVATRDGVTIEDEDVGGIPGVWVRPTPPAAGDDPLPPRRRLPRDDPVDVLAVHRRARAGHGMRPVHRRLPPRARVPVPRRVGRRDAGVRGAARRRPAAQRALRRRRLGRRRARDVAVRGRARRGTCPSRRARSCSLPRWTSSWASRR